jgi:uncharacterized damage-inducible protein DinB
MNTLLDHYRRQMRYDEWANRETLSSLRTGGQAPPPAKATRLMAHIVGAQSVWLDRLHARQARTAVWPEMTPDQILPAMVAIGAEWSAFLEDVDFNRAIHYENSRGERWSSTTMDVIAHVVNHGTYHRGQIAMALREAGLAPACTDWIHASRSGFI